MVTTLHHVRFLFQLVYLLCQLRKQFFPLWRSLICFWKERPQPVARRWSLNLCDVCCLIYRSERFFGGHAEVGDFLPSRSDVLQSLSHAAEGPRYSKTCCMVISVYAISTLHSGGVCAGLRLELHKWELRCPSRHCLWSELLCVCETCARP